MDIGAIVDYCIEFNQAHEIQDDKSKATKGTRRKATQADWDAFFG